MRVLIDTNVILDYFLEREQYLAAKKILAMAISHRITGFVTAKSLIDIYYIARKVVGRDEALNIVLSLYDYLYVADTLAFSVFLATGLRWRDFEDSVQYMTAQDYDVDYIITRDKTGFNQSEIPVKTPVDFLSLLLDHE